jgi:hypothetical protein
MATLTRRKTMLFACITACLSVLVALAVVEIYVRITRPKIRLYELTGRVAGVHPMSQWALVDAFCAFRAKPGQYAENKTVNSHGFLSTPEISVDKAEGTVRIVFLGGSSTAGTGHNLADADTWPWQTVAMTRGRVRLRLDFINAAIGGYSSFESYGRLWSRLRHFAPDIVVVYHGWNEMYYFNQADDILSWRTQPDGSWSIAQTGKPIVTYAPLWIDPLIHGSQALTEIRIRWSRPLSGEAGPGSGEPLQADYNRDGLPIWRTHLKLLRETCDIIGAKLFVAKQATLIVPDLPEEERDRCRYDFHGFDHEAHVDAFSEIYRIIDEEIPPSSIIDVTALSGRPECFFDHIHPTPHGCTEIATIVADSLVSHLNETDGDRHRSPPDENATAP